MKADTKRRLTVFGAGVILGTPLSIGLFQYAKMSMENNPRETNNVEVVLTSCELQPGDVFEERCVQKRVIAEHFVPPDTIMADQVGLWLGKKVNVGLEPGSAVRTVDFDARKVE